MSEATTIILNPSISDLLNEGRAVREAIALRRITLRYEMARHS